MLPWFKVLSLLSQKFEWAHNSIFGHDCLWILCFLTEKPGIIDPKNPFINVAERVKPENWEKLGGEAAKLAGWMESRYGLGSK